MINYQDFAKRYYPSANNTRQNDVMRFIDNLNELIDNTPISEVLTNKQTLCQVFYLQKTGNISRPHYQKVKEYLLNIFEYVGIQSIVPTREEVIASQDVTCWFRNLNALLQFIDRIGEKKINLYNPTTDLIRVKALCVLGWIGLSIDEISNLKRQDLQPIDLHGFRISTTNGTFEIFDEPFTALFYLCDLDGYNSLPVGRSRGRKIYLVSDTDYLFRPQDEGVEKLNSKQLINIISRFNMGSDSSTVILFRNLHKNALFLDIYNDTTDKPIINKIIETIGCNYRVALSYREQYVQFAKAMDNNKI